MGFQWDSFRKNYGGVLPGIGMGVPGGFCSGIGEGETAGCPLGGDAEAAGDALGAGWVPGRAFGGFAAAAG